MHAYKNDTQVYYCFGPARVNLKTKLTVVFIRAVRAIRNSVQKFFSGNAPSVIAPPLTRDVTASTHQHELVLYNWNETNSINQNIDLNLYSTIGMGQIQLITTST